MSTGAAARVDGWLPGICPDRAYSASEAARYLGFSARKISRMCKEGQLKAVRVGDRGNWRIRGSALLAFLGGGRLSVARPRRGLTRAERECAAKKALGHPDYQDWQDPREDVAD